MAQVKCPVCQEKFDRDKVDWVQTHARRYTHRKCAIEKHLQILFDPLDSVMTDEEAIKNFNEVSGQSQQAPSPQEKKIGYGAKTELLQYVDRLFGGQVNYSRKRVMEQIEEYVTEYGYSHTGILKTLQWWYDILDGHSPNDARGGIGIVPYIYHQAKEWYRIIYEAQEINKNKEIKQNKAVDIIIPIPKKNKNKKIKTFEI